MAHPTSFQFRGGDVLACWGRDRVSRLISGCTSSVWRAPRWAPSHVAVVAPYGKVHRRPCWFESTTWSTRCCLEADQAVHGAQVHPIRDRLADYCTAGALVACYRLQVPLCYREQERLGEVLLQHHVRARRPYDYAGALLSGLRLLSRSGLFPAADVGKLFCSELVADSLKYVDRMCPLQNPARFNPGRLLRVLIRAGALQPHPVKTWPAAAHVRLHVPE